MQEKYGMLEASPAPGGTKAACLLINSENITVQMLIFFPCHFPLKNTPISNCFAALLPVGAEVGQHGWCQAWLAAPSSIQGCQGPKWRIAL